MPKLSSQHHGSPYQKRVMFQRATLVTSDHHSSHDSSNDLSLDLSDIDSDDTASSLSKESKIPKLQGEAGRPGCGGYTLQTALNWNSKAYTQFKVRPAKHKPQALNISTIQKLAHDLIDEHLDTTKCASAQNQTILKLVCDKVSCNSYQL